MLLDPEDTFLSGHDLHWKCICESAKSLIGDRSISNILLTLSSGLDESADVAKWMSNALANDLFVQTADRDILTSCAGVGIAITESAILAEESEKIAVGMTLVVSLSCIPASGHGAWSDARSLVNLARICTYLSSADAVLWQTTVASLLLELRKSHKEPWRLDLVAACIMSQALRCVGDRSLIDTASVISRFPAGTVLGDLLKGTRLDYITILETIYQGKFGLTAKVTELGQRLDHPSRMD